MKNKNIFVFGNGGSAAIADHFAVDMTKNANKRTFSLNTSPLITCLSNDYGYELWMQKALEMYAQSGDIVFLISSSGNSKNVINAIIEANNLGMFCIGLTGKDGGMMNNKCDILIKIPSDNIARIQETHILIGHIICLNSES